MWLLSVFTHVQDENANTGFHQSGLILATSVHSLHLYDGIQQETK